MSGVDEDTEARSCDRCGSDAHDAGAHYVDRPVGVEWWWTPEGRAAHDGRVRAEALAPIGALAETWSHVPVGGWRAAADELRRYCRPAGRTAPPPIEVPRHPVKPDPFRPGFLRRLRGTSRLPSWLSRWLKFGVGPARKGQF